MPGPCLIERLRALVEAVPAGGSVTLPRDWLAEQLARENGAPGARERDDLAPGHAGIAPHPSTNGNRLLTAREVAQRLGCSVRYVYAHATDYPFRVRVKGLVRFSGTGLDLWIARQP